MQLLKRLGTDSDKTFIQFFNHCSLMSLLGFSLGYSIDYISSLIPVSLPVLGFIQYLLNTIVLFASSRLFKNLTKEYQSTLAGLFFIAFFFGSQVNLISRLLDFKTQIQQKINV